MKTQTVKLPALCLWCDAPCAPDVLCPPCRAVNDHPPYHCTVNPRHLDTLGPECAECASDRERARRVAERNAPIIASLQAFHAKMVNEIEHGPRWHGAEHGKGILGIAAQRALADLGAPPPAKRIVLIGRK